MTKSRVQESNIKVSKGSLSRTKRGTRNMRERMLGGHAYTTVVHRKFFADPQGTEFNLVTGVRGYYKKIVVMKNKPNLQTLAGRDDMIIKSYTQNGAGNPASNFIAVSADTNPPSTADTTLAGEITTNGMGRAQATTRTHTTGTNAWSLAITFTDTTAETAGIVKYGLFTATSSGVLNNENNATTVTLEVGDQLIVSWTGSLG